MENITIDFNDKFNLQTLRLKCPYSSDEEALKDLKKIMLVSDQGSEVFLFKDYDSINKCGKVSYVSEAIAKQKLKKIVLKTLIVNYKPKKYSFWDLYLDNVEKFHVSGLTFYSENPDEFSYFRGYDYHQLDEVKTEIIQPFLDHVHDVIANKNDEVYKYILVWIASILQKPNFKTEIALVILGNQGTGKNKFFTDVVCKLMARYANENVTSIESVVGKFNAILENKKLLVLNELQSADVNKYLNSDALKSVISDKTININQKNEPERLCENVANFIMVSNNNIPIKIEGFDRRYVVTHTSNEHRGDWNYFGKLANSFTSEFYENLFTFFMTVDISNTNLRMIPSTEAKENIKEASMSSYELFAREYYDQIHEITGPQLFDMYCSFVKNNHFKDCSSRTFISNFKAFTGEAKSKRIDGQVLRVYNLLPEVYDRFKKYYEKLEKEIVDDDIEEAI